MSEMNITGKVSDSPSISFAEPASQADVRLSGISTLKGIFFEPGRTFESLRQRPRFLLVVMVIAVATSLSTLLVYQRLGLENIMRAQIEKSAPQLSEEERAALIEKQTGPVVKAIIIIAPAFTVPIFFAIGGALYLLGVMALGKTINYKQALSVWTYSSFPPVIMMMLANTAFLFLQAPEHIDLVNLSGGFIKANLGVLTSAASHPVLSTALSAIDLFAIYGIVLAVVGLRKVALLSTRGATAIAGCIWVIVALGRVALAAITNTAA